MAHVKRHTVSRDKEEHIAAKKRDLFIIRNFPGSHYKMNFDWTKETIEEWETKFSVEETTKRIKKTQEKTSVYLGVNKKDNKWIAGVTHAQKRKHIGYFANEELAARKRDLYILENYPNEIFTLNFEWTEDSIKEWNKK